MRTLTLCVCLLFVVLPITTASEGHVAVRDEHKTASTNTSADTQTAASEEDGDSIKSKSTMKGQQGTPILPTLDASEHTQATESTKAGKGTKTTTSANVKAEEPTTTTSDAFEYKQGTELKETGHDIKTAPPAKREERASTTTVRAASEGTQTTVFTKVTVDTKPPEPQTGEASTPTTITTDANEDTQNKRSAEATHSIKFTAPTTVHPGAPNTGSRNGGEDMETTASSEVIKDAKTTKSTKDEAGAKESTSARTSQDAATTVPTTGSNLGAASKDGVSLTPTTRPDPEKETKTDSANPASAPETTSTSTSEAPASTKSPPIPDRTIRDEHTTASTNTSADTESTASEEDGESIKSKPTREGQPSTPILTTLDAEEQTQTTASPEARDGIKPTTQGAATTVPTPGSSLGATSKDGVSSTPTIRSDPEEVSKADSASSTSTPETTSTSTSEVPTSTESSPIPDRTTCSESKTNECRKTPFGKCEVLNGEDHCSCEPPLKLMGKSCRLENKTVVKLVFKVTRKSQTLYSNDDECPSDEDIKEEIQQNFQRKKIQIMEISNIKCDGGEITMDIAVLDNSDNKIVDKIKEALQDTPPTFGDFNIDREGIDATLFDQCQMGLSEIGKKLGGLKCEKKENAYLLACDETLSTLVETVDISGILVQLCQDKPCSEYCDVTQNKRCLLEKCVCKHGFVPDNGTCVDACRPNICKNGGTCQPHKEVQFMCMCPSKFKGLFCEEENKELHSAKLNIVIVGVVLSALLLMCFVVSASIISRMKKKNNLLAHDSKDVERRRELHGYDGPYNANSSASKHRDHTSL